MDAFNGLTSLKELKMNANKLEKVYQNVFVYLRTLESLDLSQNLLVTIDSLYDLPKLNYLNLASNWINFIGI